MEADKRKIEEIVNLYENNDFKELNKACEKFLSEFPNSPLGWNLYALSFKNLGNLQKAMKIYERSLIKELRKKFMINVLLILGAGLGLTAMGI